MVRGTTRAELQRREERPELGRSGWPGFGVCFFFGEVCCRYGLGRFRFLVFSADVLGFVGQVQVAVILFGVKVKREANRCFLVKS